MPPRPPLAGAFRVSLGLTSSVEIGGHVAAMIFYGTVNVADLTAANLTAFASQVSTYWTNHIKGVTCTQWSLSSVTVTAVDGTETQGVFSTPVAGGGQSDPLPPQVAACISWHIPVAYRGGHPRNYMPGISTAYLTAEGSNELSTGAAVNFAAAWAAFLNEFNTTAFGGSLDTPVMGNVSYVKNKVPRVVPVFNDYGAAVRVNTRLASQRRRSGKLAVGVYEV